MKKPNLVLPQWETKSDEEWRDLAVRWFRELDDKTPVAETVAGKTVVMMNFTSKPEQQWQFILHAVELAGNDHLGHIAAGPIEHLLGWHGEAMIDLVEARAAQDPKFGRALTNVWKYLMTDAVWERVQKLKGDLGDDAAEAKSSP